MSITFERNLLYAEVWATPLTSLAKKYGLSDNGVRKICKALNIPLPAAGHWAKVAAGKNVRRTPLPVESKRKIFVSRPPDIKGLTVEYVADELWLKERKEFESRPENLIQVAQNIEHWHPLIRSTRSELARQAKRVEKWESARAAREAQSPGKAKPPVGPVEYAWKRFEENGQILPLETEHLPVHVSIGSWERAVRIMHTLLTAANARGIQTRHAKNRHALEFRLDDVSIEVRLSEKLEETKRRIPVSPSLVDLLPPKYYRMPTGVLRLTVSVGYSVSMLEDTEARPLEQRLNDLMIRLYRKRNAARRSAREAIAREKRWAEERRVWEEREQAQREQERAEMAELARRNALLAEVRAWNDARLLGTYLDHIESSLGAQISNADNPLSVWLAWARRVASDLDPTQDRLRDTLAPDWIVPGTGENDHDD